MAISSCAYNRVQCRCFVVDADCFCLGGILLLFISSNVCLIDPAMLILIDALYEPRLFYSLHAFGWKNLLKQGKFQIDHGVCMTFLFCHAALHQPTKFLSMF